MIDILSKRYIYFAISLLVIIPGLIILGIRGLPLSIDFTGGSLLEVQFVGTTLENADVILLYERTGIEDAQVQTPKQTLQIRSSFLSNETRDTILMR
jgi:preprotein translocase subunit SecF